MSTDKIIKSMYSNAPDFEERWRMAFENDYKVPGCCDCKWNSEKDNNLEYAPWYCTNPKIIGARREIICQPGKYCPEWCPLEESK